MVKKKFLLVKIRKKIQKQDFFLYKDKNILTISYFSNNSKIFFCYY